MKTIIAKKSLFSYFDAFFLLTMIVLFTYFFIKNLNKPWEIDVIFYLLIIIPNLAYIFRFIKKT